MDNPRDSQYMDRLEEKRECSENKPMTEMEKLREIQSNISALAKSVQDNTQLMRDMRNEFRSKMKELKNENNYCK